MSTQIYLIPGFMGFKSMGPISYFRRIPELLRRLLHERGISDVVLSECPTLPSGSIARRAQLVLNWIADHGGATADSIHLIGHSTGGLDARLLAAPGVRLIPGSLEEDIGCRIRSVVTVSTPHFGTPMADLLLAVPFRQSLEWIGLMASSNKGQAILMALISVLEKLARIDDWAGRTETFLDTLVHKLLKRIGGRPDDPVWEYLREMAKDQGAAIQLTLESMHLFNAAVADRPGTNYSSLITVAPPPPHAFERGDLLSPLKAIAKIVFGMLYMMASRPSRTYHYEALEPTHSAFENRSASLPINNRSNDGVVPCLSQAYGKVLGVVLGDHMDIVGQFPAAGGDAYADWLPCGASFTEQDFEDAWSLVATQIAADHGMRTTLSGTQVTVPEQRPEATSGRQGVKAAPTARTRRAA